VYPSHALAPGSLYREHRDDDMHGAHAPGKRTTKDAEWVMMNSNGMMYSEQERKAFDLGRRMAQTGFSLYDNPFVNVHPRFSSRWASGYVAVSTLEALSSAMALKDAARKQLRA